MSDELAKAAPKTRRKPPGRWKPGQSGNPAGRPQGSRHKATILAEQMIGNQAQEVIHKVIERALEGDVACLRLCLERIAPPVKERPIAVEAPEIKTSEDAMTAMTAVLAQVCAGDLTPSEGTAVAGLVDVFRRLVETEVLEQRIAILEQEIARRQT
jgi:Family of unknown function (DUF5681)